MKLLIVVDVQNDFVYDALRNEEAIKRLPNICEFIKNWDGEILFTQDTHHKNYLETQEGKNLDTPHCIEGTKGWEICEEVQEAYRERYGNYFLPTVLKESFGYDNWKRFEFDKLGVTEIVCLGFDTDVCVVSNVLNIKTFYPEILMKVKENCCAGIDEKKHNCALEVMKSCQIEII